MKLWSGNSKSSADHHHQKSDEEIKDYWAEFVSRPIVLILCVLTGCYMMFVFDGLSSRPKVGSNLGLASFNIAVYYGFIRMFGSRAGLYFIRHKIPLFLGVQVIFLVLFGMTLLMDGLALSVSGEMRNFPAHVFFIMLGQIPGTLLLLALFRHEFEDRVFIKPPEQFLWLTWREQRDQYEGRRTLIIRMEAQNQYTLLHYIDGSRLERIGLSEAIERFQYKKLGMRVHRSHWVAFHAIQEIKFVNGNPKLVTAGGEILPMSREAYYKLKSYNQEQVLDAALEEVKLKNEHFTDVAKAHLD